MLQSNDYVVFLKECEIYVEFNYEISPFWSK